MSAAALGGTVLLLAASATLGSSATVEVQHGFAVIGAHDIQVLPHSSILGSSQAMMVRREVRRGASRQLNRQKQSEEIDGGDDANLEDDDWAGKPAPTVLPRQQQPMVPVGVALTGQPARADPVGGPAPGPPGPAGPAGPAGVAGALGQAGATGDDGPQGQQGVDGDAGLKGETGPQGKKGEKGDTGPAATTPTVPPGTAKAVILYAVVGVHMVLLGVVYATLKSKATKLQKASAGSAKSWDEPVAETW